MNSALTVVVPVHNSRDTLEKVICPLQAELGPEDRLLAVNDRSSDDSAEILSRLGVETIDSYGKPGAAGTRNTGGMAAETPWILFVDSDVVVPCGWRMKLASRMESVEAVQGVYSRKAAGKSAATFYKNYYYFHTFTRRIKGPFIKGCGTFFFAVKADSFRDLSGFDENIAGATIEDADFSERLWAGGGKVLIAPDIEVFHLREYSAAQLFRYEWNMMRAKALYILRRDRSRGAPSISVAGFGEMVPVLSGAVFSWVFIAGLVLFNIPLLLAGLLLTLAGQLPFICYSVHDGGFRGLKACSFIFPDLLLIGPASLSALWSRIIGKKY